MMGKKKGQPQDVPGLALIMGYDVAESFHDDRSPVFQNNFADRDGIKNNRQSCCDLVRFHRRPLGRIFDVASEFLTEGAADVKRKNNLTFEKNCETVGLSVNLRGLAPASHASESQTRKGVFVFVGQIARVSRRWRRAGVVPVGTTDNTRAFLLPEVTKLTEVTP